MMNRPTYHVGLFELLALTTTCAAVFSSIVIPDVVISYGVPVFAAFAYAALGFLMMSVPVENARLSCSWTDFLIIVFLVWVLATCMWSQNLTLSLRKSYYFFIAFLMYFVVSNVCSRSNRLLCVGTAFVIGCFCIAAILIAKSGKHGFVAEKGESLRTINANYIAYTLATAIPIVVALLQYVRTRYIPTAIVVIGSLFASVLLTGCRGALLSVLLCLSYVLYATYVSALRRRTILAVFVAIVVSCVATFYLAEAREEFLRRIDIESIMSGSATAWSGRLEAWSLAAELFREHTYCGIGVGAFEDVSRIAVHNVPLSLLVETGVIGTLIYFAIIITVFWKMLSKSCSRLHRAGAISLILTWLPIAASGVWETSPVAWIAFGWFVANGRVQVRTPISPLLGRVR